MALTTIERSGVIIFIFPLFAHSHTLCWCWAWVSSLPTAPPPLRPYSQYLHGQRQGHFSLLMCLSLLMRSETQICSRFMKTAHCPSVPSLPFLPGCALQKGFGICGHHWVLGLWASVSYTVETTGPPGPHQTHLGSPLLLSSHFFLTFTLARPGGPLPSSFLQKPELARGKGFLTMSNTLGMLSGAEPWRDYYIQALFSLDPSQNAYKGTVVTVSKYEGKWSHFTQFCHLCRGNQPFKRRCGKSLWVTCSTLKLRRNLLR